MAAISSCSNNNNEFKVKLKKTLPAIGNDDVTLKEPMNNCASQNGTQTCSLSSCYSSDPILMNIVHQLNIPDKLLLTPKKSFDKSRACKENETESNLTLTNTNETTNITTTTISKTLDFERLQARRRMELMQKNAELIKKFSHFKFDSFDAEEEEHDEEFAKESKDKVIRTFSANESVVEVTKDEFEPKFIKDINFEILKHPDSEQKINIKSENLLEPNFPVNRSTTKSSSKKKLPVCSNSKSLKSSLKKYPIKANVKINLDSKLALAVERKVDASSSDQKKSPVRSVSNEHLDKEKIKKKCLTESLDQSNCCLTESLPQSKSNDNEKKHVCNESKRSNNFDKLEKLIKNIGTKHENDNQAREKKQSTAGNGSNSSRIKNISVNGKPYQVLNKIGKGGSSLVYQVYCAETKQTLALKIVNLKSADKSVVEGFRSEINVLQKLRNCERVVKMYDYQFCNNNKELLIVMEKGDTDLSNVLKNHFQANRNYRFSPHLIKLYWQEMVDAVREIHENNIVHSDLKPVNFILVSGKLKLIDFGIAKAMQCNQTNVYKDTIIGTVDYMAPESFQKRSDHNNKVKYNQKVDIWSLGIILYNLVYGVTPFSHLDNYIKKGIAIVNADIEYEPINDNLLLDVIKQCLQKDPKNRPTASKLLHHPYLTEDINLNISKIPTQLLSKINNLTPNTLKKVSKVVENIANK